MLRLIWWIFVLIFGFSMTLIGLALPLVPGLPWLGLVSISFEKLCPKWWHRRWLYRIWLKIKSNLKQKLVEVL